MTLEYAFHPSAAELSRGDAVAVCTAALDALRGELDLAYVDAYSDYRDQLPSPVEQAQATLSALGAKRRRRWRRDPGMGIKIQAADDESWMLLREYAAWSIHVELWAGSGRDLGTLHDCAHSIVLHLTPEQRASLDVTLEGIGEFVLLT